MARSSVAQTFQIGPEVTPGTTVPADTKLGSLAIRMSPSVESDVIRPNGSKYATVVTNNKEWTEGSLEGSPTYDEIVYPLASVFTAPVVTQMMDGATPTGVYEWVFSPTTEGADAPKTYTVETGNDDISERASHVIVTDFGLDMSRGEVTMSGSAFGQALVTGEAITAGATPAVENLIPILPGQVCIFVDPTFAALGTTQQGKALKINPTIGGRFDPVWYLNCLLDSFGSFVETSEPDYSVSYTVEADPAGLQWLDDFRSGVTQFVRIQATGATIYDDGAYVADPLKYLLTWDFAVQVMEPGALSDEDGVYAISPTLQVIHDPAWGKASEITVRNTLAAL